MTYHYFRIMHIVFIGLCWKERQRKCLITLLNIYFIHIVLFDVNFFLQYCDTLKCINHARKIGKLPHPNEAQFQEILKLSSMKDFCMKGYGHINHGLLLEFFYKWHVETSPFHLPIGKMSINLGDVLCLLHLPITRRLLDHSTIHRSKAFNLMVTVTP